MRAPSMLILGREAVGRLNWQPRVCPAPLPCIAARHGDVLELVFTANGYDPASWDLRGRVRWRYRLEAFNDTVVLATLIGGPEVVMPVAE